VEAVPVKAAERLQVLLEFLAATGLEGLLEAIERRGDEALSLAGLAASSGGRGAGLP
jgi:hypothetical protein